MLVCMYVCVRGGRFTSLALLGLLGARSSIVEFIFFMLVFMFEAGARRLASLASLGSLGAGFHFELLNKVYTQIKNDLLSTWRKLRSHFNRC